jgi:metallo-beta-lactamase family protein
MTIDIKFCGAAGTVTGSCYWIRHPGGQFIVDCGLFQGAKTLKELNYGAFPFDPAKIDMALVTHAHIDHSGQLPKLVKHGFTGSIYTTAATRDLLSYMLPDSGYIQEIEVEHLNRRNAQRGRPDVTPIYTRADAEASLEAIRPVEYEQWCEFGSGVRARYWNAGHILGSASIEVEIATGNSEQRLLRLLFSGDIGPEHKLFHPDPDAPENFDYVLCESTYGGRNRPSITPEQRRAILAEEVKRALGNGNGMLLIPSFAIERTQELLADLCLLFGDGTLPKVPVFLDSPLAIRATEVFSKYLSELEDVGDRPDLFRHPNIHFTETVEASKAINRYRRSAIVLAASGMCEAGRIRHHLKQHLWRENATVLLVGYQAPGTLGSLLQSGAPAVRIQGEDIRVRAAIRKIDVYSGHADGDELIAWLKSRMPIKRAAFLTHGEDKALEAMKEGMIAAGMPEDRLFIPQLDDEIVLGDGPTGPRLGAPPRRLPPEAVRGLDWHNDLARFSLDLREELDKAADDKHRGIILRRLRRALEED